MFLSSSKMCQTQIYYCDVRKALFCLNHWQSAFRPCKNRGHGCRINRTANFGQVCPACRKLLDVASRRRTDDVRRWELKALLDSLATSKHNRQQLEDVAASNPSSVQPSDVSTSQSTTSTPSSEESASLDEETSTGAVAQDAPECAFTMNLTIRSRPRGRETVRDRPVPEHRWRSRSPARLT